MHCAEIRDHSHDLFLALTNCLMTDSLGCLCHVHYSGQLAVGGFRWFPVKSPYVPDGPVVDLSW